MKGNGNVAYRLTGNNNILKRVMICCIILLLVCTGIPENMYVCAAAKPKLAKKKLNMYVGETYKFNTKGCKWKSSKKKVAEVTSSGKVKAKKSGSAKITATLKKNGKKAVCNVKVGRYIKKLTLNSAQTVILKAGQTSTIRLAVAPSDVLYKDIVYISDNNAVAIVDDSGNITPVAEGTAQITAKTKAVNNKKKTLTKKITVVVIKAADDNTDITDKALPEDRASLVDTQAGYDRIITPVTVVPASPSAAPVVKTAEPAGTLTPAGTLAPGTAQPEAETSPVVIPSSEPAASPSVETPAPSPVATPLTVRDYVNSLVPSSDRAVAGQIVTADSYGHYRTLYFLNREYSGQVSITVDGCQHTGNAGVASMLRDLVNETGAVTNSARTVRISRRKTTSSWSVELLNTGTVYYISGMENDTLYGSSFGVVIAEGDTLEHITIR